jgi:acyl carrier protein
MMNRAQLLEEVSAICREVFHDEKLIISEKTSADDVEGWDSVTNLFLIDQLESRFQFKFSLDEILEAQNIGDLCNCIETKMS